MAPVKKPAKPKKAKALPMGYGALINTSKVHHTPLAAVNLPKTQRDRWKKVG